VSPQLEVGLRLADLEADRRTRLDCAVDVWAFAELTRARTEWTKTLEEGNVPLVSQQVVERQAEALRTALLRLLEKRGKAPVPRDLTEDIRVTRDLRVLLHWIDAAAEANGFDEFRAATQPRP